MVLELTVRALAPDQELAVRVSGLTQGDGETLAAAWSRCSTGVRTQFDAGDVRATELAGVGPRAELRGGREASRDGLRAVVVGRDLVELQHRLVSAVTLAVIQDARTDLLMLHAGGVADPHSGRTIALVGPSGAGKTTATRTLAMSFGYVTDETVAVDPRTGAVLPYPKPLSLVTDTRTVKLHPGPDELDLVSLPETIATTLHRVVLLDRDSDSGPINPRLDPVPLVDAIVELVPQISYLSSLPNPLTTLVSSLQRAGGVVRASYRESATLDSALRSLLEDHPEDTGAEAKSAIAQQSVGSLAASGIRRRPVHDAVRIHDVLLVLKADGPDGGDELLVLTGIAPTLWAAADGATLKELCRAAVAEHGAPPAVEGTGDEDLLQNLVAEAVAELVTAGILHVDAADE